MSKEIDLTAVFRAIVREYERIAPRLVETGIESEERVPPGALTWGRIENQPSPDTIGKMIPDGKALITSGIMSSWEIEKLMTAYVIAKQSIAERPPPDQISKRLNDLSQDWDLSSRHYSLSNYLAIVGIRAHCQAEGLSIQTPDTAKLEAFLGL